MPTSYFTFVVISLARYLTSWRLVLGERGGRGRDRNGASGGATHQPAAAAAAAKASEEWQFFRWEPVGFYHNFFWVKTDRRSERYTKFQTGGKNTYREMQEGW